MHDLKASASALPDAGAWRVAFTDGESGLVLFDSEAEPRGPSMHDIVSHWGHVAPNGTASFQQAVWGQTGNYSVTDHEGTIRVIREGDVAVVPFWSHDSLITAFARNAGYLIHVEGSWNKRTRIVSYRAAEFLSRARTTRLIELIADGTICIDFDAYIRDTGAVRNHGTKFRIKPSDLHSLYAAREGVE